MKCTHILRKVFQLSLTVLVFACVSLSQTGTTSLHGVVTDKSGAAIAGAAVKLTNPEQNLIREMKTGSLGEYEFLALPPGTYSLTVETANFRKFEQKNIQLP